MPGPLGPQDPNAIIAQLLGAGNPAYGLPPTMMNAAPPTPQQLAQAQAAQQQPQPQPMQNQLMPQATPYSVMGQ